MEAYTQFVMLRKQAGEGGEEADRAAEVAGYMAVDERVAAALPEAQGRKQQAAGSEKDVLQEALNVE